MATKLFLKQFLNSGPSLMTYSYASKTASVLAFKTAVTNKVNGTTQDTATAGGSTVQWISPPLAAAVTISGTITYNFYVLTSSTTGAPKSIGRVFKYSGGVESQFSTKTSTLVQSTSAQLDNFTDTAPTSTSFAVGDRIVLKKFTSSSSATGTETLDYGGKTAASDGDSWVQFTETLSFQSEPEFIQSNAAFSNASGNTVMATMPGISAAGNAIVVIGDLVVNTETMTIADDKTDTVTNLQGPTDWTNGSGTFRMQSWLLANIAGGSATAVTLTKSATNTNGRSCSIMEYGGVTTSPLDTSVAFATGTNGAPTSNTLTIGYSNEILIGIVDSSSSTVTFPAGYVGRFDGSVDIQSADSSVNTMAAYLMVNSSASQNWIVGLLALKWGSQPPNFGKMLSALGVG